MEEIEEVFDTIREALSFEDMAILNDHLSKLHQYADSLLDWENNTKIDNRGVMSIRLVHMYCKALPILRPIKKPDQ